MATRLLLLRHARVAAQYLGHMIGATDIPSEPLGESQTRALAERVARWAPQTCYCSPMQRCRQMASATASDLPPIIDPDLREINFGQWETRTFAEVVGGDPALMDRWARLSPDFAFPGGESVGDFLCRVRNAAERLVNAPAPTVLAVAHGGVIRTMICHLLGLDPRHYLAFDIGYSSLAVIDLFDGRGTLAALERADRMEAAHG